MSETVIPTKTEVQQALDKILSIEAFEGSPTRRSLLQYMVEFSLKGEEKQGPEIASVVFPFSAADSSNVKVTVSWIREKLASYYADAGAQDFLRIDLPIGRTYKAIFSYRFNPEAVRLYERGLGFLGVDGHPGRLKALECFDLAIRADANFAAAHLAKFQVTLADVLMKSALAHGRFEVSGVRRTSYEGELEAVKVNARSWRAWCLHGTARMLDGQVEKARGAFETALSLNPEKTNEHIGYAFYVLLTGSREEALRLSALWDKSSIDGGELVARGLFFYLAGERESAIEALQSFRVEQNEMIIVNLLLQGLVNLEADRYHWEFAQEWLFLASLHWTRLQEGFPLTDAEYWELLRGTYKCRMLEHQTGGNFWRGYRFPTIFPGFNIMALAKLSPFRTHAMAEAKHLLSELEKVDEYGGTTSLQLAIGALAVGRKDKAVKYLRRAINDGDVWGLYSDRLPFLAGLQGYPAFETLKEELATEHGFRLNRA